MHLQVRGRRLDTGDGPRTRSRAKTQAEQWESVSLPLKLMALSADALVEALAQRPGGPSSDDDASDEWVEADDDEDDYGKARLLL